MGKLLSVISCSCSAARIPTAISNGGIDSDNVSMVPAPTAWLYSLANVVSIWTCLSRCSGSAMSVHIIIDSMPTRLPPRSVSSSVRVLTGTPQTSDSSGKALFASRYRRIAPEIIAITTSLMVAPGTALLIAFMSCSLKKQLSVARLAVIVPPKRVCRCFWPGVGRLCRVLFAVRARLNTGINLPTACTIRAGWRILLKPARASNRDWLGADSVPVLLAGGFSRRVACGGATGSRSWIALTISNPATPSMAA